jgi:hypothetical protein
MNWAKALPDADADQYVKPAHRYMIVQSAISRLGLLGCLVMTGCPRTAVSKPNRRIKFKVQDFITFLARGV